MTKSARNESYLTVIPVHPVTSTNLQRPTSFKRFFKKVVFVLGSLHLTFMSAFGIWLWSNPGSFGTSEPCTTSTAILGRRIPLGSRGLRVVSLCMYSLFLTPGLNLVVPMVVFLGLYIRYQTWRKNRTRDLEDPSQHESRQMAHFAQRLAAASSGQPSAVNGSDFQLRSTFKPIEGVVVRLFAFLKGCYYHPSSYPSILPIFIGLFILVIINLIFIADIELTLRANRYLQESDESEWGFGQILAMLLLVMPLRDLLETIFERRENRWKKKNTEMLQNAIKNEEVANLKNLITNAADVNIIVNGVNIRLFTVNQIIQLVFTDCKYATALQLALCIGDQELVKLLLSRGADVNVIGETTFNQGGWCLRRD
jgi:hypothetical protein